MKKNIADENHKNLQKFLQQLGISPRDFDLYKQALTHKSYKNEAKKNSPFEILDNQRLEFLGDAVLGVVITEYIFLNFPNHKEGMLTRMRSNLVCAHTLSNLGKEIGIGDYLLLGKGAQLEGGKNLDSNIGDAMEALIGAIYLDAGLQAAKKIILHLWKDQFDDPVDLLEKDAKSALQEWTVKHKNLRPEYRLLEESGPDHHKKFLVGLYIQGRLEITAQASNRKYAEHEAARLFLQRERIL